MVVYSEGKLSYNEAWALSTKERTRFIKVLNNYIKKKNGQAGSEDL
jgi:hypothetical protein